MSDLSGDQERPEGTPGREAPGVDASDHETAGQSAAGPAKASPATTRKSRGIAALSVLSAAGLGVLGGLGAFTFGYGDGAAYLTNNPASCANCHVMQGHYDAWVKSSHHNVATCNDCHLPHDFAGKWITKGDNGFFHSLAFTTGGFHEPIQIKPRNRRVTQNACLHCHADYVDHMLPAEPGGEMLLCVHCHGDVGHAGRESGFGERD